MPEKRLVACHARFDHALLSLFTMEMLARPFTILNPSPHDWTVFGEECELIGYIQESGELFEVFRPDMTPVLSEDRED